MNGSDSVSSGGVSICIPTFSGAKRLRRLFKSFPAAGVDERDEVLVRDDASPDEEAKDIAAAVCDCPGSSLTRNEVNAGPNASVDDLARLGSKLVILTLDDDVVLPTGFMLVLRQLMELPGVGALSWKSCGIEGTLGHHAIRPIPGYLEPATHLAGYCMAYRREVFFEIGGYDRRFRKYFGDSEFSLRATLAGYPSYRVWWPLVPHEEGASTKESALIEQPPQAAARDVPLFEEKYGTNHIEMERRAFKALVDKATR